MAKKKKSSSNNTPVTMPDISGILRDISNENTAKTFAFNASEAEKSRDFSKMMSDTSHQREVEDLKRAGLNPVLSSNSGAQAYSASSASGSADNSAVGVLASLYQTKMNNDNAVKLAKIQNSNNLEIARINAAAQAYSADQSSSASRYATDLSKSGLFGNFLNGILSAGDGTPSGSSNHSASKIGKKAGQNFIKNRQKYTLTGRIINAIANR